MASIKKSIPPQLIDLIQNGIDNHHRSLVVMAGSYGADRIPALSTILHKKLSTVPSVLWCYSKEANISSNRQKRNKQMTQKKANGTLNEDLANSIDLFFSSNQVQYAKYSDTQRILGKTYNMLILQDYQALTPNILARTVETVAGGGLIVILLQTKDAIDDIYATGIKMDYQNSMSRDVFGKAKSRFNVRFMKKIRSCKNCIAIDDEFDILKGFKVDAEIQNKHVEDPELDEIKAALDATIQELEGKIEEASDDAKLKSRLNEEKKETEKLSTIIEKAVTSDQAKTVSKIIDTIKSKNLGKIIGITAARGRGKSAALGLSLAAALALGYSNLFVTSPSIQNVASLFEFVVVGLNSLGYKDKEDYEVVESRPTSSKEKAYTTRIIVHYQGGRRQQLIYVKPNQSEYLGQCEILAIDEAAAIPLPIVKDLIGQYTTLFSSTVDGYEGTGRALSLKLFEDLKQSKKGSFSQIKLTRPIRYAAEDPIEEWLHELLLLDVHPPEVTVFPPPSECKLYCINRDLLFSGRKTTEKLLRNLVSLSVESHYKNSPNDLTLMADAPNHQIFALMNEKILKQGIISDIYAFVQVALEGSINEAEYSASTNGFGRRDGDLIPWNISRSFNRPEFAKMTGARVVRIAVHPSMQKMHYGSEAIKQLQEFYLGDKSERKPLEEADQNSVLWDTALFAPCHCDYMGVSFGLTKSLLKFWKNNKFVPLHISPETNEITGEHSIILVQANDEPEWLSEFQRIFKRMTYRQLPREPLKDLSPGILEQILLPLEKRESEELRTSLSEDDVERLRKWTGGGIYAIKDLIEPLTDFVFEEMPPIEITGAPLIVLLIIGKQMQNEEEAARRLTEVINGSNKSTTNKIGVNQINAYLQAAIGKIVRYIQTKRGDSNAGKKQKIIESEDI